MNKKVRVVLCMVLAIVFVLGMSTTAFAATYSQTSGFKYGFVGTNIATKAADQKVFDYNSYFRLKDTTEDVYYRSRPCNSGGSNIAAYQTNFSGGSNIFNTQSGNTSVRMEIDNYYHSGTKAVTYGTFGGTY